MSEVLVRYTATILGEDGRTYVPQACGRLDGNLWEGWIEFVSTDGVAIRTPRETEQPNRTDLMYWAQGLTGTYLEGALDRALGPHEVRSRPNVREASVFPGPASGRPLTAGPSAIAVLDPFTTFAQGEDLLRGQLRALSRDNLANIMKAYNIADPDDVAAAHADLVDAIVMAARSRAEG